MESTTSSEDPPSCSLTPNEIDELYFFRMLYNASTFNEWGKTGKFRVHKAKKHFDGEQCFGGEWFIVMADTPNGQISNHYKLEYYDLFKIKEQTTADEWDGHTSQDVRDTLTNFLTPINSPKEEFYFKNTNHRGFPPLQHGHCYKLNIYGSKKPGVERGSIIFYDNIIELLRVDQADSNRHNIHKALLDKVTTMMKNNGWSRCHFPIPTSQMDVTSPSMKTLDDCGFNYPGLLEKWWIGYGYNHMYKYLEENS